MDVPPSLFYSRRHAPDIEDVAATFIEQEVGKYDWKNNWPVYKNKPNLQARVLAWLKMLDIDVCPSELINELDRLHNRSSDRWVCGG